MRFGYLYICVLTIFAGNAHADDIYGMARVLSADTLIVDNQIIHLRGVAAPEPVQYCQDAMQDWACGRSALDAVVNRLTSKKIHCNDINNINRGDISGVCYTDDETNSLNQWIVASGWALAGSDGRFLAFEQQARDNGLGIWRNGFNPAPRWRSMAESGYDGLLSNETDCDVCAARHLRLKRKPGTTDNTAIE